ncbi:hypothetical protein GCM10027091_40550 [Streptomyces daliensis]
MPSSAADMCVLPCPVRAAPSCGVRTMVTGNPDTSCRVSRAVFRGDVRFSEVTGVDGGGPWWRWILTPLTDTDEENEQ